MLVLEQKLQRFHELNNLLGAATIEVIDHAI